MGRPATIKNSSQKTPESPDTRRYAPICAIIDPVMAEPPTVTPQHRPAAPHHARKPPFTESERNYLRSEFARFARTGYGINPNQPALRHLDDHPRCPCHWCTGAEICYTREMIPVHNFRRIDRQLPPAAQIRMNW